MVNNLTISERGIDFLKELEAYRHIAYKDGAGNWTIGWGHTDGVKEGDVCDQAMATLWLHKDVGYAEGVIDSLVTAKLNQNQFDALCCLVYNIGVGAFKSSTVLKELNINPYIGLQKDASLSSLKEAWLAWNKITVNGKHQPSPGLLNRREKEWELFISPLS